MRAPYMRLFVADYVMDTLELTAIHHGAYLMLLMAMWRAGGKLPAVDAKLAALARCTFPEWIAMKPLILSFFRRRGGILTHKRVTFELSHLRATSEARARAGVASGRKRASKNKEMATTDVEQNPTILDTDTDTDTEKKEPSAPKKPAASRRLPETLIPAIFPLDDLVEAMKKEAGAKGANLDMAVQAQRFRDFAETHGRLARDWPAAWRMWARKSIAEAPKEPTLFDRPAPANDNSEWEQRVRSFATTHHWNTYDWGPVPYREGCRVPAEVLAMFPAAQLQRRAS